MNKCLYCGDPVNQMGDLYCSENCERQHRMQLDDLPLSHSGHAHPDNPLVTLIVGGTKVFNDYRMVYYSAVTLSNGKVLTHMVCESVEVIFPTKPNREFVLKACNTP